MYKNLIFFKIYVKDNNYQNNNYHIYIYKKKNILIFNQI
jgi:hypothetical protein